MNNVLFKQGAAVTPYTGALTAPTGTVHHDENASTQDSLAPLDWLLKLPIALMPDQP